LLRLKAARHKTDPVLTKVLRNELSVADGAQKVKRLVPDKELMRELFGLLEQTYKTTPEQVAEQRRDIRQRERELKRSEQLHEAAKANLK